VIEHIRGMCEVWGGQRRYREYGIQGYSEQAPIGKIQEFRLSEKAPAWFRKRQFTAKGIQDFILRPTQFTEEGHTGDGLLIAKALGGAPEVLRVIAYVQYVIIVIPPEGMKPSQYKAEQLGLSYAEMFRMLDRLDHFILGRLPPSNTDYLTVSTEKPKFGVNPVKLVELPSPKPKPALDFSALQRERLTLYGDQRFFAAAKPRGKFKRDKIAS
jgi:hypothetical protein